MSANQPSQIEDVARIAAYYYTLGFWEGQSKDSADCVRNKQRNLKRAQEQSGNPRFVSVIKSKKTTGFTLKELLLGLGDTK